MWAKSDPITCAHLHTLKCGCRATRKSRGIALVQFAEPAGAAAAAAALDGATFQGRLLHVLPARAPLAKAAAQACLRGPGLLRFKPRCIRGTFLTMLTAVENCAATGLQGCAKTAHSSCQGDKVQAVTSGAPHDRAASQSKRAAARPPTTHRAPARLRAAGRPGILSLQGSRRRARRRGARTRATARRGTRCLCGRTRWRPRWPRTTVCPSLSCWTATPRVRPRVK